MTTTLITGANRGIGFELTRQLCDRGEHVIAACRSASDALAATGAEIITGVDVADDRCMPALTAAVGERALDLLINCAGILTRESLDDLSIERIRTQFEVNTLGPLRVTHALLGALHEGSRVAIITSRMGSVADNTSGGMYGYRVSKCAVNMVGRSLAHDLAPRGISVFLLHPGMVATDMTGGRGIPVEESASGLIARLSTLTEQDSGTFWHQGGELLPW